MISIHVTVTKSSKEKIIGFIGRNTAEPLLLKTRFGIHTFFLRFPIDVVILNKECIVKKIKVNLKPNSIFVWNPQWNNVLELPQGYVQKHNMKIGQTLSIIFSVKI